MDTCNMKNRAGVLVYIYILVSFFTLIANAEFYSAISGLESLLHTEGELVKILEKYIETEEKRLDQVKWISNEYEKMYKVAIGNSESFLSNPVNAYLLVKRLTADWKIAGDLIGQSHSLGVIESITNQSLIFPDEEDLNGAATALLRLQDTYRLNTTNLANGEIEGTSISSQLSAGDCFELGSQAFNDEEYHYCIQWMQEALNRLKREDVKTVSKFIVLEKMAYAHFMLQKIQDAIDIIDVILEEDPDHPEALENLSYFEYYLTEMEKGKRGDIGMIENEVSEPTLFEKTLETYEKLCRGESFQTSKEKSKLFCRYTTNRSHYLLLHPVKEEVLSIEPKIIMFHDVISDTAVDIFKRLSQPKLERATVHNPQTRAVESASYRVSKSAWLDDWEDRSVARTNQMIEEITGLSMDTSEPLHVINYGIGGHYEPHFDFRKVGDEDGLGTGNRIATWIYYLSDVDAGGYTVFPSIGVQVKPKKGSAAFWYNLKKSGAGDLNTKHAACPVLAGSKWIANKWLHESGQEFRRPCSLNRFE